MLLLFIQLSNATIVHNVFEAVAVRAQKKDTITWSSRQLRLKRGGHLYKYHNYTPETSHSAKGVLYSKRETILHYEHVIQQYADPSLFLLIHSKRAFSVNPANDGTNIPGGAYLDEPTETTQYLSWNWMRQKPECPVIIYFCFKDGTSQFYLDNIVDKAFAA